MKTPTHCLHQFLLAAAVALPILAATGAVHAADMRADAGPAMEQGRHGPAGAGARGPLGPPPGFGPGPGPGSGAALLRGVELTEAQDDQVFAILHAETPYLREQARAAGKARQALRALADADKYDDAKAASLAQAAATADANIALQHARTRQKLLAVLTPEQRKQQAGERQDDGERGPRR